MKLTADFSRRKAQKAQKRFLPRRNEEPRRKKGDFEVEPRIVRIWSVVLPIRTGKNIHFDEIFQKHLVFFEIGWSTILSIRDSSMPSLRMHHDGGTGQKAPPATHLTVALQFIEL